MCIRDSPTLASLIEERMKDDPALIQVVVHSLNQWMYETWQFNYDDRIFATPVISMGLVDEALAELDWVIERGARCVLIRPAPVPGPRGTSSPGLPQFDPIWSRISDAGILVGMHASDSGYNPVSYTHLVGVAVMIRDPDGQLLELLAAKATVS